jgi:hypothetical protein
MTQNRTSASEASSSGREKPGAAQSKGRSATVAVLVAIGAVVAVTAGLAVMVWQFQPSGISGFESADGRALFQDLGNRLGDAQSVAIRAQDSRVTVERAESGWRLAERDGYPVREGAVDEFLRKMAGLKAALVSETQQPAYGEFGVNAPGAPPASAVTVSVKDAEGREIAAAALGHTFSAPGLSQGRGTFIRVQGDTRVWLADSVVSVPTEPAVWLEKGILDIPADRIQRIELSGGSTERLVLTRNKEGELHIAEGPSEDASREGATLVSTFSGLFTRLAFEDIQAADALPPRFNRARRAVVRTTDGVAYTVDLLTSSGDPATAEDTTAAREIWARFSAAPADDTDASPAAREAVQRFNERHSGWAYRMPLYVVDNLSVSIAQQDRAR